MLHKPVLLNEVVEGLKLKAGSVVVDGTLGAGGHAERILKEIGRTGLLVGVDQDPQAIERCTTRFKADKQVSFHCQNFKNIHQVLDNLKIDRVDAVILDVGFSSDQLEDEKRGFSFEKEGPLDMRMNPEAPFKASDIIKDLSQIELERIFREYGEERWAKRFAMRICEVRKRECIETTDQLVRIIKSALPGFVKRKGRLSRNPATRVFQALRIAVNDELNVLREALVNVWPRIGSGGRLMVISFHSLEDRIVKYQFRDWANEGSASIITKKPVVPSDEEIERNVRSRSAKLRIIEKI